MTRAHARGHTGVLRHGGPLLFRFLPKQSFAKSPRTFLRVPPEKRPLTHIMKGRPTSDYDEVPDRGRRN
jgi:hypothetical protein